MLAIKLTHKPSLNINYQVSLYFDQENCEKLGHAIETFIANEIGSPEVWSFSDRARAEGLRRGLTPKDLCYRIGGISVHCP